MMKPPVLIVLFFLSSVVALPQSKSTPGTLAQSEAVAAPSAGKEAPKTLRGFKGQFMNQDVIVKDSIFDEKYCLQWATARKMPDGTYERYRSGDDPHDNLPIGYRGQTGTVVDVRLSSVQLHTNLGGTNALGDSISQDDVEGLFMEVVVRFKDGTLGACRK
jgi:hypothetical protein